jgi:hypothetical protein
MDEVREWESARGPGDPGMIIFTDGDADEEKKLGLGTPIIVDKEYRTAVGFGMRGVPSAVLIDGTGTIVTEAGIGSDNIWSLIGRRK